MVLRAIAAFRVEPLRRLVRISLTTVSTVRTNAPANVSAPEQRMEEVDEGEIDRHPRQVEQRRRPLAAEEAAHGVDVATALQRFRGGEAEARHVDGDAMRQRRDLPVEPGADADQHLGADDVEAALEQVEADRQRRQHDQRRDAAAGQRPVVDLHHVERAGQRQDVDHPGDHEQEQHDAAKASA